MKIPLIAIILVSFTSFAYAQPLENIQTTIIEKNENTATVKISWDHDSAAKLYKIGCVSCQPNTEKSTTVSNIILPNVTPIPNGDIVLYLLSLDENNEIITGKQIVIPFS